MNEILFNELREAGWRRALTPAEQAQVVEFLAAHPQAQAAWEEDLVLSEHLRGLAPAPVSSNFTARVLQAAAAELAREERAARPVYAHKGGAWFVRGLWRGWLPRFAVASVVLVVGLGGIYQQRAYSRAQTARHVALVAGVLAVPGPERLRDFEVIRALPPDTDDDLLAALQQ
jgi:negative regulator of sigma E activity